MIAKIKRLRATVSSPWDRAPVRGRVDYGTSPMSTMLS